MGFDHPVSKQKTPIKIRYAERLAQEARIAEALAKHRLSQPDRQQTKRPGSEKLQRYIDPDALQNNTIREIQQFRSATYNPSRRLKEFVDHLFVRYPVPLFLYRSVLTEEGWRVLAQSDQPIEPLSPWEQEVFLAAAQGRSVADIFAGKLTRKETHWFLNAPDEHTSLRNVVWARLVTAGAKPEDATFLVSRLCVGDTVALIGERIVEIGAFFAVYGTEMSSAQRINVADYLRAAFRDPKFTLKGRTLGSVIELCELWHITDLAGNGRVPFKTWTPVFGLWETEFRGQTVRVVELTNSRALAEEGRAQRHCVYTYMDWCEDGYRAIVSLRWIDSEPGRRAKVTKRLTIEVGLRTKRIVQVRGMSNRTPDDEEMKVLKQWMRSQGVTLRSI